MKWRPISELSDEQRDGRLWVFAWQDNGAEDIEEAVLRFKDNYWQYSNKEVEWGCEVGELVPICHDGFFLSEPLPDLPKPQKMEWRRFEDEMPEDDQLILVHHPDDKTFYKSFGKCDNKAYMYWMPIIPPEGE